MDAKEIDQFKSVLDELKRLINISTDLQDKLLLACCEQEVIIANGYADALDLFELLQANETADQFLKTDTKWVIKDLFRLLVIHFRLKSESFKRYTIADINNYIQQDAWLKKYFTNRTDTSLIIAYLEYFNASNWMHYATCTDGDHSDMSILSASLPFCRVDLDSLLQVIAKVRQKYPDRGSYRLMGGNILINLQTDQMLRTEILNRLSVFFEKTEWKEMFPLFLKGAINDDPVVFEEQFDILLTGYPHLPLPDRLYALAVACPENEVSLAFCYHKIRANLGEQSITPAEYLHILRARNRLDADAITYMLSLAAISRDKHEIAFLSDILLVNEERFHQEIWYRTIAQHIIPAPFPELVSNFNQLLAALAEKDPKFVYELLKLRFAVNGAANFLEEPWHELPDADLDLFEKSLVDWINTGNRYIHLAIHHLTSNAAINSDKFKLSLDRLTELSTKDKYYLACKITGYVYDKHALRSLLFSLTAAVREDEPIILEELYNIFTGYVIHNYRSTLDEVKKIVATQSLPAFLIGFYRSIIEYFEAYFKGLDQVPSLIELRPDPTLGQHIRFYTSQQVSEQFKDKHNEGLGRFFKNVTINSHRWAIRRPGEDIHKPQTLGTVRSEMEFPAGQILNPVSSERFRVVYQQLEKHEININ